MFEDQISNNGLCIYYLLLGNILFLIYGNRFNYQIIIKYKIIYVCRNYIVIKKNIKFIIEKWILFIISEFVIILDRLKK